jgi:hypothetical protein
LRRSVLVFALAFAAAASAEAAPDRTPPAVTGFVVSNGGSPFAGDHRLLSTISPNGDGFRDRAAIRFRLDEPAAIELTIARTASEPIVVYRRIGRLGKARHTFYWSPEGLNPRTYVVRLIAIDRAGNRRVYGPAHAREARLERTPVIRLQGVDAGFAEASYAPGQLGSLSVATDAASFTLQLHRAGPEREPTYADNVMNGVPVAEPVTLLWRGRQGPRTLRVRIPALASGLYFAKLTADDGRVGYAPFVVRPPLLGGHRVAVVLPTNTWQAYNYTDEDGDGWGDTWYAGPPNTTVKLGRPFTRRGVPPHFKKYDLGLLHWLAWSGKAVDYLSDGDLERVNGLYLAKHYDLIVFGGHEEYVTEHVFNAVTRYRDLGGNLIFLSANNFFWRVQRTGATLRRDVQWRDLGRPEAALVGVQYKANDGGRVQRPFVVRSALTAPWLWEKTDLVDGSTFGEFVGGFGIEIDATTRDSPPGTIVLAEIPDLFGPGYTAQMTYYETPAGAKVFAAGALDFGGHLMIWPHRRMLENLWLRLSAP